MSELFLSKEIETSVTERMWRAPDNVLFPDLGDGYMDVAL